MSNQGVALELNLSTTGYSNLEWIRVIVDNQSQNDEIHYNTTNLDTYCKMWTITPSMLTTAGCIDNWGRIVLTEDQVSHVGSNYTDTSGKGLMIIPEYTSHPVDTTDPLIKLRELTTVKDIEQAQWNGKKYQFLQTQVKKDIESLVSVYDTKFTSAGTPVEFAIKQPSGPYHGKVYWEEIDIDTEDSMSDQFLLFEVDYDKGYRKSGEIDWTAWAGTGATEKITIQNPPSISTYTSESGYIEGTNEINARWKHAAVSGRQVYIGNIQQPIDTSQEMGAWNNGKILKGAISAPGGFSDKQYIDLELGSDYITCMVSQADRLFVFSKKKLTIVNVAQDLEFLEDEFEGYGVMSPRQVTKVEGGIAIINATGVHVFNGKEFVSISDEKLRTHVRWHHNQCKIIYEPLRKNLFCWPETDKLWLYNLVLNQWVYTDSSYTGYNGERAVPTTNNVAISIGNETFSDTVPKIVCIFYCDFGTPGWYYLDYAGYNILTNQNTGDDFDLNRSLTTGVISLGDLSRRKKIYKVRINCKTTDNSIYPESDSGEGEDNFHSIGDGDQGHSDPN